MGDKLIFDLLEKLQYINILKKKKLLTEDNQLTEKAFNLLGIENNSKDYFKEWMDLWPKNLLNIIGYTVSGNTQTCKTRMAKFMKSNSYDWETIIQATKMYLSYQENRGWEYTKKNYKFIQDKESSALEAFCEMIENNVKPKDNVEFL